jgi:hypothetical protein
MGYIWMVVPILPILLGIAIATSIVGIIISSLPQIGTISGPTSALPVVAQIIGLYAFAIISVYAILVLGAIAIYYLIERRNNHFRRQQQLYKTLGEYVSAKLAANPSPDASKLSQLAEDSMFEEQDRPASLWAILYLFVTPITSLIVAYESPRRNRRTTPDYSITQHPQEGCSAIPHIDGHYGRPILDILVLHSAQRL